MNVKLENVRLSFPNLFTAKSFDGNDPDNAKFGASFILDKNTQRKQIKQLVSTIDQVANDHFNGKPPKSLKKCLRDGVEKEDMDGYGEEVVFLSASTKKRPTLVNRDLTPVSEEDAVLYAGCYVNVSLRIWAQDNSYGKRINAQLRAVQFVKDGEAFGEGSVNAEEEFENLESSDEEDEEDKEDDNLLG